MPALPGRSQDAPRSCDNLKPEEQLRKRVVKMTVKILLLIVAGVGLAAAQTGNAPAIKWSDTTRDVYLDNELDRGAQVLTADSPSRLALISARLDSAVVLNVSELTVSTIAKEAFQFTSDRTSASSQSSAMKAVGKFTRIDGPIYFFVVDGKPVIIRAHAAPISRPRTRK